MNKGSIPIYRALVQPNLFMGGERNLMLFSILICVMLLVFSLMAQSLWMFIASIVLWVFLAGILRLMANRDPMMSEVYRRHQNYINHYPPYDSVWRKQ